MIDEAAPAAMGLLQNESGATAPFSVEKWFCAVFWGTNC